MNKLKDRDSKTFVKYLKDNQMLDKYLDDPHSFAKYLVSDPETIASLGVGTPSKLIEKFGDKMRHWGDKLQNRKLFKDLSKSLIKNGKGVSTVGKAMGPTLAVASGG